jgi:riboflavin biosynthesis pyrimidine reductase
MSGSGRIHLDGAIFRTSELRVVIITTASGHEEGRCKQASPRPGKRSRSRDGSIDPNAMLHLLFSDFGVRALLHECGPTLLGQFLRRTLVTSF